MAYGNHSILGKGKSDGAGTKPGNRHYEEWSEGSPRHVAVGQQGLQNPLELRRRGAGEADRINSDFRSPYGRDPHPILYRVRGRVRYNLASR